MKNQRFFNRQICTEAQICEDLTTAWGIIMKAKVKIKNNQLCVRVKVSSGELISGRELDIINMKSVRGLLKPAQIRKNLVEYTGPAGLALSDYLNRNLTEYEFFYYMAQIVTITRKLRSNNLLLHNLILDLRYVFVNETTKELQFIYLPIQANHVRVDVIGFMETIIYAAKISEGAGMGIARYAEFLRMQNNFDPQAVEEAIARENGGPAKRYHSTQSSFLTDKPKDYYEHYENKKNEGSRSKAADEDATWILNEASNPSSEKETGVLGEAGATGLLGEEEATGLLETARAEKSEAPKRQHYASLYRVSTGKTIEINKPVFRLGKERNAVDYFVDNAEFVSRSHADIITRGTHCFVIDQSSRNYTYINDAQISAKIEVEIKDGDTLRLADEEFVFHI